MRKLTSLLALTILTLAAAACGGDESVSNNGIGDEQPIDGGPTPTPEPIPEPTPQLYSLRVTLTNIHIYENGDLFGNAELYFTFAVQDTVAYTDKITAGDNVDVNPADYGLTPIDVEVVEGDELYIYVDGYDDDIFQNDPLGTVNTGWYASDEMFGAHTVAAQNPYRYDVTYRIDRAE